MTLEQPPLFDESQLPVGRELLLPEEEQQRRFTGAVVARNQSRYQAIVQALGEGLGVRQICRAFGVSHHVVQVIRERDAALVATEKQDTGRKLRRLVRLALERFEDGLANGEITAGQIPVATGILIDKSLAWEGHQQPITVRHELELDQWKLRAMFAALQAPVIDVELAPDSESGALGPTRPQKGLMPLPAVPDVVIPPSSPPSSPTAPAARQASPTPGSKVGGGERFQTADPAS
jgi:hypothetical protein